MDMDTPHKPETMADYLALIPPEHKTLVDGHECLNEMGMIHLCTLVERHAPQKAALARKLRYAASKFCQQLRNKKD